MDSCSLLLKKDVFVGGPVSFFGIAHRLSLNKANNLHICTVYTLTSEFFFPLSHFYFTLVVWRGDQKLLTIVLLHITAGTLTERTYSVKFPHVVFDGV